jgi:hypothetical protein
MTSALEYAGSPLARASVRGEWLCRAALVVLPLAWAAYWLMLPHLPRAALPWPLDREVDPLAMAPIVIVAAFVVSLAPLAAALLAIDALARLCASFRHGAVFTAASVRLFRQIGSALLLLAAALIAARMLTGVIFHLPQRQLTIGIGFTVPDLLLLALGGLFRIMTHVMAEAATLAREHAEIV